MKGIGVTLLVLFLIAVGSFLGLSQSNLPERDLLSELAVDGGQSYVLANGDRIYYQSAGSGPDVVLLAPFALQMWDPLFATLIRSFRVTRVSLPGVGLSFNGDPLNLDRVNRSILALLAHLKVQRVRLVGYDAGAAIVYNLQADARNGIDRVVLISPRGIAQTNRDPMSFLAGSFLAKMSSMPVINFYNNLRFKPQTASPIHNRWLYLSINSDKDKFYSYFELAVTAFSSLRPLLSPGLLVWGEENRIFPAKYAKPLAQRLGMRSVKLYPNQGHALIETHAEELSQDLVRFLK
jgi:pimeloyl-ACP methyl ester carboxylesterase